MKLKVPLMRRDWPKYLIQLLATNEAPEGSATVYVVPHRGKVSDRLLTCTVPPENTYFWRCCDLDTWIFVRDLPDVITADTVVWTMQLQDMKTGKNFMVRSSDPRKLVPL